MSHECQEGVLSQNGQVEEGHGVVHHDQEEHNAEPYPVNNRMHGHVPIVYCLRVYSHLSYRETPEI